VSRLAQPLLEHIAAQPGGVGLTAELAAAMGRKPNLVTTAALILKRRGLITAPVRGRYHITEAGRAWLASGRIIASGQGRRRYERTGGLRERAWWLMREMRKFTVADLLTTLADGSERDAAGNLGKYLTELARVGVVVRMKRRVPGVAVQSNGHVLWWLKHDLGRIAPVWRQRHGVVFDPNSGAVLPRVEEGADV
jgi:predicted transcriptional regulator